MLLCRDTAHEVKEKFGQKLYDALLKSVLRLRLRPPTRSHASDVFVSAAAWPAGGRSLT